MEYGEFERAVIDAFVRRGKRKLAVAELIGAVFHDNSTAVLGARAIHDQGQKQAALFSNFIQRLQDEGLVIKGPVTGPAVNDNSDGFDAHYERTDHAKFTGMQLAAATGPQS